MQHTQAVPINPTEELKHWKPLSNPYVSGVLTATFPKIPNPETKRLLLLGSTLQSLDTWIQSPQDGVDAASISRCMVF